MKYLVKMRQVVHREYFLEVDAANVVEAMNLASEAHVEEFGGYTPDMCCKLSRCDWAPVSIQDIIDDNIHNKCRPIFKSSDFLRNRK